MHIPNDISLLSFESFEKREHAFAARIGELIPRKYSGIRVFWHDFNRISMQEGLSGKAGETIFIMANPRDGIAFSTPWQALAAAAMTQRPSAEEPHKTVDQIAEKFGLNGHLHQSIRTLSGGETVKLALAKADILADLGKPLVIASPFTWLSAANQPLLRGLWERFATLGLPVEVFALTGETSDNPVRIDDADPLSLMPPVQFHISLRNVTLRLGSQFNPLQNAPPEVAVEAFSGDFLSPCLVSGENGQGKSLIAKILSGAVSFRGSAWCAGKHRTPMPARLLFQDAISQTLLRDFEQIITAAEPAVSREKAMSFHRKLLEKIAARDIHTPKTGETRGNAPAAGRPATLFQVKILLTAVRLAGRPPALILDEPDWGLTRRDARAFVLSVIETAHEKGIPVILISHKPWWRQVVRSTLHVRKAAPASAPERHGASKAFRIIVESEKSENA